jgi:hypothetical protein
MITRSIMMSRTCAMITRRPLITRSKMIAAKCDDELYSYLMRYFFIVVLSCGLAYSTCIMPVDSVLYKLAPPRAYSETFTPG